jgi:hypothetical protein
MGHGSSDAILDLLAVTPSSLQYQLGATLRPAGDPLPNPPSLRPFQVQIATPPPRRTDGSEWFTGLRVVDGTDDGRAFDPNDKSWMGEAIFPLQGISPLGRPDPATLIFEQAVTVDRVTNATDARASFTWIAVDERPTDGVNNFLSLPYPLLRNPNTGRAVRNVAAAFYHEGTFPFTRTASGFAALSLEAFASAERPSVEYIFFIP